MMFVFGREFKLKQIALKITQLYLDKLDDLVRERMYPNSSEAIRIAIRDLLKLHGVFEVGE